MTAAAVIAGFGAGLVAGFAACGLVLIRREAQRQRDLEERAQRLADAQAFRLPDSFIPYPAIPATNAMYARTGWS